MEFPRASHVLGCLLFLVSQCPMADNGGFNGRVHRLPATPHTVQRGYFAADVTPVLRVASGDIIDVDSLITNDPESLEAMGLPPSEVQQSLRDITSQVPELGTGGHILTGPVFVAGALRGNALEIRVLSVSPAIPYGYFSCSDAWTFVPENCEPPKDRIIRFDLVRKVARPVPGIEIPLSPFFGILGVAPPPEKGRISSLPPGAHGGNMDMKNLVAGTVLYLPVFVDGALLSVGDGHAAQGDGEVGGTAIETSLRGKLQLIARNDLHIGWPRVETPTYYMTFGANKDLVEATRIAVGEMTNFLMEKRGLSRSDANVLTGVAADLHMSEIVDENMGVYMTIPKSVFRSLGQPKR
jgi:acetamidase/formamidase